MQRPRIDRPFVFGLMALSGCTESGTLNVDGRIARTSAGLASADGTSLSLADGRLVIEAATISVSEIELEGGRDDEREANLGAADIALTLDGTPTTVAARDIEAGSYHTLGLELKRNGTSISVQGSYENAPFVFTSGLDFEAEFPLTPEVNVPANGAAVVGVVFDVGSWFTRANGELFDPRDPKNQSAIEARITASIAAGAEIERSDTDDD